MSVALRSAQAALICNMEQHAGTAAALYKCARNWPIPPVPIRMHRSGHEQSSSFYVRNWVNKYVVILPRYVSL